MQSTERKCLTCDKLIKGRTDKKFCDDYCRNTYNNQQNSDANNHMRNINKILRKNRRVLALLIPNGQGMGNSTRLKMAMEGYDFTYHTHTYMNKKGDTYHFCYDLGYLLLENDRVLIVRRSD